MNMTIVVDTGVLSAPTAKTGHREGDACRAWFEIQLASGAKCAVPEIADYELRRELLRAGKVDSISRLNSFNATMQYVPLTTSAVRKAAELWAQIRNQGQTTAPDDALDGDVLLCAQVLTTVWPSTSVVVATTNVNRLSRFVTANVWRNILPMDTNSPSQN